MFKGRKIDDIPLVESWRYYEQLLQQQDETISSGADIEAFRYGLGRFAKLLTRIILTTASHGVLDHPFYETTNVSLFSKRIHISNHSCLLAPFHKEWSIIRM
jgi:hypothetical protein